MKSKLKFLSVISIAAFVDGHIGAAKTVHNPGFHDLVGVNLGEHGAATSVFHLNPGEALAIKIDDVATVQKRNAGHAGYALGFASANSNGPLSVTVATADQIASGELDFSDPHNSIARVIPSAGAGSLTLASSGKQPWHIEDAAGKFYVIANTGTTAVTAYFQGSGAPTK